MSRATELADEFVRYCPECGLIGPMPEGSACCPDSFGMSVRRWQAEKMERMLDRLRSEIVRIRRPDQVMGDVNKKPDGEIYSHSCRDDGVVFATVEFTGPFDPNNQWTWPAAGAKVWLSIPPSSDPLLGFNRDQLVDVRNDLSISGWGWAAGKAHEFISAALNSGDHL